MFAQRLSYIMELTGTQASALGRACALDASHISRLRNGSRPLPKKQSFLAAMSEYLARRVTADYQKNGLCDAMRLASWPMDETQGALLIMNWLSGRPEQPADVRQILSGLIDPPTQIKELSPQAPELPRARSFYYGAQGKREAVLQFFDMILREKAPRTLLLSSDEEFSWLYEDPAFAARWAGDFTRLLHRGNRVRIIHSTGRDWNEMLQGISKWVPIYTTGMIEPYYYPRLRDGICQRTVFIAPGTAAIVSSSVTRETDGMLNELITDRDAVAALTLEYERYLSLCRPLMRILTERDADELWSVWGALARAEGDLICMSAAPTLATMPESVAIAMQRRAPDSRIYELWRTSVSSLERLLERSRYTELLPETGMETPSMELPCAGFMGAAGLRYTADELAAHWDNARALARTHTNYTLAALNDIPANLLLYGKEGRGVIMAKCDAPGVAFAISEANLTNAFWDYLTAKL